MDQQSSPRPLPFFYVGKEITKQRIKYYADQKHNLLSNAIGKQDTKNIWYSKEHIVKLLEEINYAGGDGIRIYFGSYEPTHEFAGQTCLVMNSTREVLIGDQAVHKDVVLENEANYAQRSSLPRDIIAFPGNDLLSPVVKDFNFGSPCPPRCDFTPGDGD